METATFQPTRFQRAIVSVLRVIQVAVFKVLNRFIAAFTDDRAVHPPEKYSWTKEVEALYPGVRKELEEMLRHVEAMPTVHDIIPMTEYQFKKRDWRQVPFYLYGDKVEDHCELYPKTWAAFQRVPNLATGTVSILSPHESVPNHIHSYKGLLIFHLGVMAPSDGGGCGMRIGDETVSWREGGVTIIDPTFAHETWNRTDHYRVILLGEFRRPDMPKPLKFLDSLFVMVYRVSPMGRGLLRFAKMFAAQHRAVAGRERSADSGEAPAAT